MRPSSRLCGVLGSRMQVHGTQRSVTLAIAGSAQSNQSSWWSQSPRSPPMSRGSRPRHCTRSFAALGTNRITDHATPNLPAVDLEATSRFYLGLGFAKGWRDDGWMIMQRGELTLEFFPHPNLVPSESWFSCCLRLDDLDPFHQSCRSAGVPDRCWGVAALNRVKARAIRNPYCLSGRSQRIASSADPERLTAERCSSTLAVPRHSHTLRIAQPQSRSGPGLKTAAEGSHRTAASLNSTRRGGEGRASRSERDSDGEGDRALHL